MKTKKKTVTTYHCGKCDTGYQTAKEALACEKMPKEVIAFKRGTRVRAKEKRQCPAGKSYVMHGVVTRVLKAKPADEDYENRHLGGRANRIGCHVREYVVTFTCPCCKEVNGAYYYAPELKLEVSV